MKDLIVNAIEILDADAVLKYVQQALDEDVSAEEIIQYTNIGMEKVGKLFDSGEYFVADLMMAGIIFKEILEMPDFQPTEDDLTTYKYKILVGTVYDDLHDIGKDIFCSLAKSSGFQIIDIGTDVSIQKFADYIIKIKPDILAMSGVLGSSIRSMHQIVEHLDSIGLRKQVKVIVGGPFLDEDICAYIGADACAKEATEGVKICNQWMKPNEELYD